MSRVGVVLDASAVLAYARLEGISVGELIASAYEDGTQTGIPVLVMVDVWPSLAATERAMLNELAARENGPVVVLPMHAHQVPAVAAATGDVGYGAAQAVAATQDFGATLATFIPGAYEKLLDPYDVLELS